MIERSQRFAGGALAALSLGVLLLTPTEALECGHGPGGRLDCSTAPRIALGLAPLPFSTPTALEGVTDARVTTARRLGTRTSPSRDVYLVQLVTPRQTVTVAPTADDERAARLAARISRMARGEKGRLHESRWPRTTTVCVTLFLVGVALMVLQVR